MAANPAFAATPRHECGRVTTGNTNRDGTGSDIITVFTAGTSGSKIDEITVKAEDNPADSIMIIWLHDGTNYRMWDEFDLGDPADATNTVTAFRESRTYRNLRLPSSSWTIRAQITVTPTAGGVLVHVDGGDF